LPFGWPVEQALQLSGQPAESGVIRLAGNDAVAHHEALLSDHAMMRHQPRWQAPEARDRSVAEMADSAGEGQAAAEEAVDRGQMISRWTTS
jgi:predicted NBD/HSP70 family sugar kinase